MRCDVAARAANDRQTLSIALKAGPRLAVEGLRKASVSVEAGIEGAWPGKSVGRRITLLFAESWSKAIAGLDPKSAVDGLPACARR